MANVESISPEESFQNGLFYYLQALAVLALSPDKACERYGYFNVAAELQIDCAAGAHLVNNPSHSFSEEQRSAILAFSANLAHLPPDATRFTKIKQESIERMEHSAWISVRGEAQHLLTVLKPVAESNARYFAESGAR